ncbi:hypothetical protein FHU41_001696 [Psychromicrobium silvestre]|uniref:Uncharacterized protein n=1 Tax=Psychromicrobium silvestre TaxID=1645614 RepID=A0A7Y9LTT6_9MICC|nr:hypothetical protein [Psychromicrobium silvestre]NYE95446.1 hypothetical protein [Psychromicrobium silvestre]
MQTESIEHLEVLITEPSRRQELLDNAEAELRQVAMTQHLAGILITRHHPGRYTISLNDSVPFGETREQILS